MMNDSLKLLLPVVLLLAAGIAYVSWTPDAAPATDGFEHPPVSGFGAAAGAAGAALGTRDGGAGIDPSQENVSPAFYTEIALRREQLAEHPADTLAMRKLARLLQDGHGLEEAAELYEGYLELAPGNRQVWLDLAATHGARRRWDAADQVMTRMLVHFPGDESALYNRGAIAANAGRKSEAERLWRDLVSNGADETIVRRARSSLEKLAGS